MIGRSLAHVLLSLLLLVAQQMALSHVVTHWSGQQASRLARDGPADRSLTRPIAKDQACQQCLAFAQVASALGRAPHGMAQPVAARGAVATPVLVTTGARAPCAFRSRGPPTLA
jgi:hypothetical protein